MSDQHKNPGEASANNLDLPAAVPTGPSKAERNSQPGPTKKIITRFGHLVSAHGLDGLAGLAFFLLLAWRDQEGYGRIMYALAAGSIVTKIIQFGLYYPLVGQLGHMPRERIPALLNQANIIKLSLLVPTMIGLAVMALWQNSSASMAGLVLVVGLGHALEAMAETFFAKMRVEGRQDREARIKIAGAIVAYGYGLIGLFLGWPTLLIGCFKLISGLAWLGLSLRGLLDACVRRLFEQVNKGQTWLLLRTAAVFALIQILGTIYNKTNVFFLERAAGVKGVAYYSAAYSLVDPISILASEQLLGSVVFPMLAVRWWKNRHEFNSLVHGTALWLLVLAWPIMFLLYTERELLIGLIYPAEYGDAVWMLKYLVAAIFLSFENNLFAYVMMVAGAVNSLLFFFVGVTVLNMAFNLILVGWSGLAGSCLVIVFTKLAMTVLTFWHCQMNLKLFRMADLIFPMVLIGLAWALFGAVDLVAGHHVALGISLVAYGLALWGLGPRFLGRGFPIGRP